nr:MAG TPA: holin [Caudoviricetes sp.]
MEIVNSLIHTLMPYVITIVGALAGYVAVSIKNKLDEKLNTDTKRTIAKQTVQYVQQVYQTLNGPEKLDKAINTFTELLNEKGIKVTEVETRVLIESAVKSFKDSWENNTEETGKKLLTENKGE